MATPNKYSRWRVLLASNKITKTLQELREVLAKSDRLDEILQQSGRYASLRKSIRLGIVSHEDETVTENQNRQGGLLQLVESRPVDTSYGKLRRAKPEEIIGAMYELEDLTEPQLKLLSVFAVLPPDKIPGAHLEVLLDDFAELEEPLLDLAQRVRVESDAGVGSFRCSPVVQMGYGRKERLGNSITITTEQY